jgi:hypothetical protein
MSLSYSAIILHQELCSSLHILVHAVYQQQWSGSINALAKVRRQGWPHGAQFNPQFCQNQTKQQGNSQQSLSILLEAMQLVTVEAETEAMSMSAKPILPMCPQPTVVSQPSNSIVN